MECVFQFLYLLSLDLFFWQQSVIESVCQLGNFVSKQDFAWRENAEQFDCVAKCSTAIKALNDEKARKPSVLQRVFTPDREVIDCYKQQRQVTAYCNTKCKISVRLCTPITFSHDFIVRELIIRQVEDYPLLYFPVLIQERRFKAEKFCRSHLLDFSANLSMLTYMQAKDPIFPKNLKLWTSDVEVINATSANRRVACKIFNIQQNDIATEYESCSNLNFFICTLPDACHADKCASRCSGENCKAKTESKERCIAECVKPNCGNELAAKFGYKPSDGDFFEKCGYQYLVSKSFAFSQNSARMFCCTKQMSLVGFSSDEEPKCLAAELIRRNLQAQPFWTSANISSSCPKTYFWCNLDGSAETVDPNFLPTQSDANKKWLTAQVNNATGLLAFTFEDGSSLRRTICKRLLPERCTESVCIPVGCELEYKENLKRKFAATKFYRPGCKYVQGCKRFYDISTILKETQFQAAKYACANFDVNTTFSAIETKEEYDCLLRVLKANNISSGLYYVSASSFGCPRSIRWCNEKDNPPMVGPHIRWDPGEPSMDPTKECVYARYNSVKNEMTFGKVQCKSELWYIKESEPIYDNITFGLQ